MWAEPFHCDFNHELQMGRLGNCMLNAADFHSTERGFGMRYLNTVNRTWVLSRLCIEMDAMPQQYAHFSVHTWVESALRYFTNRNFMVKDTESGQVLGYGRSVWALIDLTSRQPQDLLTVRDGDIANWIENGQECPIAKPGRAKLSNDSPVVKSITTTYSDIDVNGHVNSVRYIEHVLDLFSPDYYRHNRLRRMDIAYVAESHYGDTLSFSLTELSDTEKAVRIMRADADGQQTEVVRCILQFEAR